MNSRDFVALKNPERSGWPRLIRWLTSPPAPPPLRVAVEGHLTALRLRWLMGLVTSRRPDLRVRRLDADRLRRITGRDPLRTSGPDPWFPRWCRLVGVCFVTGLERTSFSPRRTQADVAGLERLAHHLPGALIVWAGRGTRVSFRMLRVAAGPQRARPTRWRVITGWTLDADRKEERRLYRPRLRPEYRAAVDRIEEVNSRDRGIVRLHISLHSAQTRWRVIARLAALKAEGWRLTDDLVLAVAQRVAAGHG